MKDLGRMTRSLQHPPVHTLLQGCNAKNPSPLHTDKLVFACPSLLCLRVWNWVGERVCMSVSECVFRSYAGNEYAN